jgi:hypothetical protein
VFWDFFFLKKRMLVFFLAILKFHLRFLGGRKAKVWDSSVDTEIPGLSSADAIIAESWKSA